MDYHYESNQESIVAWQADSMIAVLDKKSVVLGDTSKHLSAAIKVGVSAMPLFTTGSLGKLEIVVDFVEWMLEFSSVRGE